MPSIKLKLGALVIGSVTGAAFVTWLGLRFQLGPTRTFPIAMAVAILLTLILARGMTSPLRQMRDSARAMAAGDYSQRVRASSRDEVGQLAIAFNAMATELAQADRGRRDLIANVAHEIRTPIAALRAELENIVDGVSEPTPAALEGSLRQTERLTRLVTYLLDLSRLDAGASSLDIETIDVESFLADCVNSVFATASQADVRLRVEVTPSGLTIDADRDRLEQVFINLLDNAIRHTPDGSAVTLSARDVDGGVVIDVIDEGPGIAVQDRERIFARFVRGEAAPAGSATARNPLRAAQSQPNGSGLSSGTGIGLSIVRWAVELHGGSVRVVDSTRGSVMRVTLPRSTSEK
ncbi:HAMP domain-containing sensor histidine kinase [Rarobacter faecitabidus]|uniref:HAMP domain-containing sensor histidine kinase n=1 Tax=Rarobacter faecitabidus TaxID=13243 RepID=UPI001FEB768F|nr:ATP-binding protein [Rarobacter faecitabidus]